MIAIRRTPSGVIVYCVVLTEQSKWMATIPCYWPLAGKPGIPVDAFSHFLHKPPARSGQFYFAPRRPSMGDTLAESDHLIRR
jgi:hypothetical protein